MMIEVLRSIEVESFILFDCAMYVSISIVS